MYIYICVCVIIYCVVCTITPYVRVCLLFRKLNTAMFLRELLGTGL